MSNLLEKIFPKNLVNLAKKYVKSLHLSSIDPEVLYKSILDFVKKHPVRIAIVPSGYVARKCWPLLTDSERKRVDLYDNFPENAEKLIGTKVEKVENLVYQKYGAVIISSTVYIWDIYQQLIDLGIPEDLILTPDAIIASRFSPVILSRISMAKKPRIIHACRVFCGANLPRYIELRKRGFSTFLLSMTRKPYMCSMDDVYKGFDEVFHCNPLAILTALSKMDDDSILITLDGSFDNTFSLLCHSVFKGRSFHEIYDIGDALRYVVGDIQKDAEKIFGEDLWKIEDWSKTELYKMVDGIIYRESPKAFEELCRKYLKGEKKNSLLFLPFIPRCDLPKVKKLDGFHIVNIGAIKRSIIDPTGVDRNGITILKAIPILAENNIHLHLYNPLDDEEGITRKNLFSAVDKKYHNFLHYHKPIFGQKFIEEIARYHAGWMVYDCEDLPCNIMKRFSITLSTRIFSYIAAGLPIFISPELDFMHDILQKEGIAIPLSFKEIDKLPEIVKQTNWQKKWEIAKIKREDFFIEGNIDRFLEFILKK